MANRPQIAIIGAGIFVKSQYVPRLAEISDIVAVKYIWSRSEESARGAIDVAKKHFAGVECKWGEEGLDEIGRDDSVIGVAVVLAAQYQNMEHRSNELEHRLILLTLWRDKIHMVDMSLKFLKVGKHVLQEKPAATNVNEIESALARYKSVSTSPGQPLWAVAENYRFEPAFVECKQLLTSVGDMMNIQVIIEGSMNSSNPYFSSSWRRNFRGGFILDMGVHYIAGLRMLVGCEVTSVSAITSHVDATLPSPDNISSNFKLENGCSGVFVMVVSSRSPKILWRVVGLKGTLQLERGTEDGRHGYLASLYGVDGQCKKSFYPFSGVNEELKAFVNDISQAALKKGSGYAAEPRYSFMEGARDFAILEAMLESGAKNGALVDVKRF